MVDLDKNDDTLVHWVEVSKTMLNSKRGQKELLEFELLLMEKAKQVYELLLLNVKTCFF